MHIKAVCKMLVKLTSGDNFTNILQAAFLYKNVFAAFMCLQLGFVTFCRKEIGAKAAGKMLVKLTLEQDECVIMII